MRSLTWKFALAFWLVSLTGIVLVALLAGVLVRDRSAELEQSINRDAATEALQTFYVQNGGWPTRRISNNRLPTRRNLHWQVIDTNERVVFSNPSDAKRPSRELIRNATPLVVDGQEVGRLILLQRRNDNDTVLTPEISQARNAFLSSISRSLAFGAVGATALSLVLGIGFARQLTKPIKTLTHATRAIAKGELEQQVPIHSKDELGKLAASFNQMGLDLADAQRARRQMTADIAHDLRTPLSVIQGHTEALLDGVLPPTAETFSIIHDESLRLNRLIEDLRTLSLADAGKLPLQLRLASPTPLLARTLAAHKPLAEERSITLRLGAAETLPELQMDPDRMAQVLDNLVSNALRHTPAGGEVVIGGRRDGNQMLFTVKDDGVGISAENLPHVFDRFYRADRSRQRDVSQASGGSGLGLAISKSVVEQHGGTIAVTSQPNHGSTFTIRLPIGHTL